MNMKKIQQVMDNKTISMSNITTTMGDLKVNYNTEMMSLYEYLGKAAGSELGKAVAAAAVKAQVPMQTQEVSNSKYTGKVLMYPKTFLDNYFKENKKQQCQSR